MSAPNELLTAKQFSQRQPCFSEASIRDKLFYARERVSRGTVKPANGFGPALRWVGRKVLIDPAIFFQIVDIKNGINLPAENVAPGLQK